MESDPPSLPATPELFRARLEGIPPAERDRWVDSLWGVDEVPDDEPDLPRGCVPYLPCPVATVVEAIDRAQLTHHDVFVDVGSGTGRAVFVARLATGAACVGLEIQSALVAVARARASRLHLERTRFVEGDAAEVLPSVTTGTVFFLYCPFGRERVDRLLDDLESVARSRPIRICCVHMPLLERPWLVREPSTSADLDVYRSTCALA